MKLILPILLAVLSFAGSLHAAQDPAEAARQFKESLKTVDRLVVERYEMGGRKLRPDERILLDIKDPQVIATLGETIEINEFRERCLCIGDVVIHFYQGKEEKFPLTLDHYYKLRADSPYKKLGQQSPWADDAILTEASAAKFRAWFAEHGYDGFVTGYASAIKAGEEAKREWELFLELFPESVRGLFPGEAEFVAAKFARSDDFREEKYRDLIKDLQDRGMAVPPSPEIYMAEQRELRAKREQWLARYPDRAKLILDCWRGIGKYELEGINPESPVSQFLSFLVDATPPGEIGVALERLSADEEMAWIGAYLYYEGLSRVQGERRALLFSEEWLARVAKRAMPIMNDFEQWCLVRNLAKRPAVATNQLLLEIAESGPMVLSNVDDQLSGPRLPNAAQALLELAENKVADCRPVIGRRLAEVTDTELRLALEVALAQFDGPAAIKPAHLQSTIGEVAEVAWRTISKDPMTQISIETLTMLAGKSASYRVRVEAIQRMESQGMLRSEK